MDRDKELDKFKTEINLVEYAMHFGYQLVKEKSSSNSKVLENQVTGDKIVVATEMNGHGIYFSVTNDESGSIIDFVQHRQPGSNLGHVRTELRPWLKQPQRSNTSQLASNKPLPSTKDLHRVFLEYSRFQARIPAYLTQYRGIQSTTLRDTRFCYAVKVDANQNAIFPHFNGSGLSGYEIKGDGKKHFSSGGEKGFWYSSNIKIASKVVICESAIDALSYAQMHPNALDSAFISIGGGMSQKQLSLLKSLIQKIAERKATLILAVDNDESGDRYIQQIGELATEHETKFVVDRPNWNKDWNEYLLENQQNGVDASVNLITNLEI